MKWWIFLQRLLAGMIDVIVVYIPFQLVVGILFGSYNASSIWLVHFLFILYNVLAILYFSGKTLGKYFARLKVVVFSSTAMEVGQREIAKLLYLLPLGIGMIFMFVSVVIYWKDGRFLHDAIGRSEVIVSA